MESSQPHHHRQHTHQPGLSLCLSILSRHSYPSTKKIRPRKLCALEENPLSTAITPNKSKMHTECTSIGSVSAQIRRVTPASTEDQTPFLHLLISSLSVYNPKLKKKNPRGLAWVAPPRPARPLQLLPLSPNSYRIWHHHFVPNYFICFTTLISEELIFGWKWKQKKKIIIAVPSIHITSDSLQQSMHVLYV